MRPELVVGNESPLFKPKLQKLAETAERAHLRAYKYAARSVANMACAGRALRKFRDLADEKEWEDLIMHKFEGSERTVQRYMYLTKHWSLLEANAPPERVVHVGEQSAWPQTSRRGPTASVLKL